MNGYFSRLMKQSGISAGPAGDPASALPAQPPARIDLEESVESRRGLEAASEVSGPIVEELVRGPAEQILHREVPEPRRQQSSGRAEGREPGPRGSERTSPRHRGDTGEPPTRVDAVEGEAGAWRPGVSGRGALELDETVEGASPRADERSPSGASGEALAFEPDEEPRDPAGRERVWRSTFEEVRGWVAESPEADDGVAEIRDVSQARAATTRPEPAVPSAREELETRDLRLEIGTISVTVEEPQREIPATARRTEIPEKKPAGFNGERSRLSRHYVRVR